MKQYLLLVVIGLVLFPGCARHYAVTLTNGSRITAVGKPHLEGANYVFKDAKGQPVYVPAGRVREIAPSSMASSRLDSGFKAEPRK